MRGKDAGAGARVPAPAAAVRKGERRTGSHERDTVRSSLAGRGSAQR
jgi:hypothetical protein